MDLATKNVSDYVTVSIDRKVIPGQEENYEQWISGISTTSASFPGHLGVHILRPAKGDNQYTIIYRFDNHQHAKAWENSEARQTWIEELKGMVEGNAKIRSVTGLESWFDLPKISTNKQPDRLRMCIVLIVVVFSLIVIISYLLSPLISHLNYHLRIAIIVTLQVILMTYVVMPRITVCLKKWLYR